MMVDLRQHLGRLPVARFLRDRLAAYGSPAYEHLNKGAKSSVLRLTLIAAVAIWFSLVLSALYFRPPFLERILPLHASDESETTGEHILSPEDIANYVSAINDLSTTTLKHMDCLHLGFNRYESLKAPESGWFSGTSGPIEFFFALNLRNNLELLPRLMGTVLEAIRYLGPHRCAVSIVEGISPDGTGEVLEALRKTFKALGTPYYFVSSSVDSHEGDRIEQLAKLRNAALEPLLDSPEAKAKRYTSESTSIIFLNDVGACPDDILELILQQRHQTADMVCGFDWNFRAGDYQFYDVWIARSMVGDTFFPALDNDIQFWDEDSLFWNDPESKAKFDAHQPFQVFACWNGMTVFTAAPILEREIAFRMHYEDECLQGEPQLFCKDMWFKGWGRIAAIPNVAVAYDDHQAGHVKIQKGFAAEWARKEPENADKLIDWKVNPPDMVKCIPVPQWEDQFFEPWNHTLS
jgi:alpha-1,3-mannosyltransferase